MIEVDSPAPAWNAVDQDGIEHSSASLKGKWYLLYFYPKDDTPGCTTEACGFRDAFPDLSKDISILGVSGDSAESHRAFKEKYDLPFSLLVDADRALAAAFGAGGLIFPKRVTFLVDHEGIIRVIYKDFDCNDHAATVLRDLERLHV